MPECVCTQGAVDHESAVCLDVNLCVHSLGRYVSMYVNQGGVYGKEVFRYRGRLVV